MRQLSVVPLLMLFMLCKPAETAAVELPYPHLAVESQPLFMSFFTFTIGPRNLENTQFRLS